MTDAGRLREQTDQPPPLDLDPDDFDEYACRVCGATIRWTNSPAQVAAVLCSTCHHSAEHGWAEPDDARALRATVAALTAERDALLERVEVLLKLIDLLRGEET